MNYNPTASGIAPTIIAIAMMFPYYITVSSTENNYFVDIEHGTVEHKDGWSLELLKRLVVLALKHKQRSAYSEFSGEHLMYPVRKCETYQELINYLYPWGLNGSPFKCCYYFMGRWEDLNYSQLEFMKMYNESIIL